MNSRHDEYLEALWCLREQESDSLEDLQIVLDIPFDIEVIDGLASENLVMFDAENKLVTLTEDGLVHARALVRKHRLAERLLHDVLRIRTEDFEIEACTFEHLVAPQVVEAICTLLGHPRKCPHGLPIPEGTCCQRSEKNISASVTHLANLMVGEKGHIAYVNCQDDTQLHLLNGLQLKPGAEMTLHQKYPSYVVECEGGMIALDDVIAESVHVWKKPAENHGDSDGDGRHPIKKTKRRRFWHRR